MFKVILMIIQSSRFQLYVGMILVSVLCRGIQIIFSSALVREALLKAGGLSKNLFRTSGGACYRLCKNRCRSGNLKNSWKIICHILCLIVVSCQNDAEYLAAALLVAGPTSCQLLWSLSFMAVFRYSKLLVITVSSMPDTWIMYSTTTISPSDIVPTYFR